MNKGFSFTARHVIRQIFAIGVVTFQELLREKILWSAVMFSVLCIGLAFAISQLSYIDQARLATDFGLAAVAVVGSLISIIMGSALIAKEAQNRTLYLVLTKAIWRWQYILGRNLGLLFIMTCNCTLMIGAVLGVHVALGGKISLNILYCLALFIVEFGVLAAIACIFSVFTTSALGAIVASGVWVVGHAMADFQILLEKIEPEFIRPVLRFASWVLPDLTRFDLRPHVSNMLPVEPSYVIANAAYGLVYIAFALTLACVIFSRRDL